MEPKDVYFGLFEEHFSYCRHHETQRATVTGIVVAAAMVLVGIIFNNGKLDPGDIPALISIIVLGVLGLAFSLKSYERYRRHRELYRKFRDEVDKLVCEGEISKLSKEAKEDHKSAHPILSRMRGHRLWISVHIMIAALGIVLTISILLPFGTDPSSSGSNVVSQKEKLLNLLAAKPEKHKDIVAFWKTLFPNDEWIEKYEEDWALHEKGMKSTP